MNVKRNATTRQHAVVTGSDVQVRPRAPHAAQTPVTTRTRSAKLAPSPTKLRIGGRK